MEAIAPIAAITSIALNVFTLIFMLGVVYSRLVSLDKRVERLEGILDTLVAEMAKASLSRPQRII